MVHAVNNMMAFGIVILAGQEINIDRSAGTGGPFMLVPMAVLVVATVVLSPAGQALERPADLSADGAVGSGRPAAVVPGIEGNATH